MPKRRLYLLSLLLLWGATGCSTFMAHRLVQAPNSYPDWFAPAAPVLLGFSPNLFTNFPKEYVKIASPPAKLCYRIVEPANYHLTITSSNWLEHGKARTEFDFDAKVPAPTNGWTSAPHGTVILLHGYALAQFSMAPWALQLAQNGWRCVLVDLRGHGKSTGKQIYFGLQETNDLSQLLDQLARDGQLQGPVSVMGESYGAAIALRWRMADPRVGAVVAIAPYGSLSNAVMNIRNDYASWVPKFLVRGTIEQLPKVLGVSATELDTTTILARHPVPALFITGTDDQIAPVPVVTQLQKLAAPGSELITISDATHETLTYYLADLTPAVLAWLSAR